MRVWQYILIWCCWVADKEVFIVFSLYFFGIYKVCIILESIKIFSYYRCFVRQITFLFWVFIIHVDESMSNLFILTAIYLCQTNFDISDQWFEVFLLLASLYEQDSQWSFSTSILPWNYSFSPPHSSCPTCHFPPCNESGRVIRLCSWQKQITVRNTERVSYVKILSILIFAISL